MATRRSLRPQRRPLLVRGGPVRFYQVERQSQHHAPAKSKVRVCKWEDGRMEIHCRGQELRWKEIAIPLQQRPKREQKTRTTRDKGREEQNTRRGHFP